MEDTAGSIADNGFEAGAYRYPRSETVLKSLRPNQAIMEFVHTLHVKNMVCQRCILTVKNILASMHINVVSVRLGKIVLPEALEAGLHRHLSESLRSIGLEIIESRVNQLIEDMKQSIRDYMALGIDAQQYKLSGFISARLAYDFGYLSDLFSKVEGITVERYFMLQRLEKVKELLAYDQLSLSEISYDTGFSSVHHLSSQFKKLTGLTPSQYRHLAEKERMPLDLVGVQEVNVL